MRETSFIGETHENGKCFDLSRFFVVPGFVDIHIHGCVGTDNYDGTRSSISKMAAHAFLSWVVADGTPEIRKVAGQWHLGEYSVFSSDVDKYCIISNIKATIYGKKSKQRHKRVAASTCLFKTNNEKLLA
jgi:hypothetical protein